MQVHDHMRATDENLLTVHVVTGDVAHWRRLHTANEMIAGVGEIDRSVVRAGVDAGPRWMVTYLNREEGGLNILGKWTLGG